MYEYEIQYEHGSVTFPEPLLFMLVSGREGSSWDEMGMSRDNVEPDSYSMLHSYSNLKSPIDVLEIT